MKQVNMRVAHIHKRPTGEATTIWCLCECGNTVRTSKFSSKDTSEPILGCSLCKGVWRITAQDIATWELEEALRGSSL